MRQLGEDRGYRGAVGATTQERTDGRRIVDGVTGRIAQQFMQSALERFDGLVAVVAVRQMPVEVRVDAAVAERDALSGKHLPHRPVDGARTRHHMAVQIVEDGLLAKVAPHRWMRDDTVGIRGENEPSGRIGITHGARAQAVDGDQPAHGPRVDDGDREWPEQLAQAIGAMLAIGRDERRRRTLFRRDGIEVLRSPADVTFDGGEDSVRPMDACRTNALLRRQRTAAANQSVRALSPVVTQPLLHAAQNHLGIVLGDTVANPAADAAHGVRRTIVIGSRTGNRVGIDVAGIRRPAPLSAIPMATSPRRPSRPEAPRQ